MARAEPDCDVPCARTSPGHGSAISMFGMVPKTQFVIFIQALEENQYLRVLAEPTLVAQSGEEANFLVGGEFPIPVAQGGSGLQGAAKR